MPREVLKITGLKELEAFLSGMPDKFNYKFLTGAHKEGLKPFVVRAKQLAPELGGTESTFGRTKVTSKKYPSRSHKRGNLKESIGMGLAPRNRKQAMVWAGPRSRMQFRKGGLSKADGWYAHMVEFGHVSRRKDGTKVNVAPVPFIRNAWDQTFPGIKLQIQFIYKKRIEKYWDKMASSTKTTDPWGSQRNIVFNRD